ncbi:hypothetical protein [Kineothrix sp. MB12-C1]|uniref:hypothetical protein n=1 Tax=Kineothrix sp. MB12-C1 TaxID=3070215 RepID=UPI0027D2025C|nr:hypothetical protein [Kineothrix sp. MB12-C1]WMC91297.1 hypothetical protein RBB56_10415 [Kineothrix sp. MB12-C1]
MGKRTSNRLIINKKEMVLIKNSETCKDIDVYGNLFNVLDTYQTLSYDEFEKNNIFDSKSRTVLLTSKKMLVDEIKNEWSSVGHSDIAVKETRCQLCGRINKFVFFIHNKNNDRELNVGSECINGFKGIENFSNIRRSLNEQIKHHNEQVRRIEFEEIDIDNVDYIKNVEMWFKELDILLPYNLYDTINTLLYEINFLRTSYIKVGGNKEEIITSYFTIKKKLDTYQVKAKEFYKANKRNKLACNRKMSEWLKNENQYIWESVMKNNGMFSLDTLMYAYNKDYVEEHIPDFSQHLQDNDIKFIGINGNTIRFLLENQDYVYSLTFLITCKEFMKEIGCHCLTKKEYRFNKFDLPKISIEKNPKNFNALYTRMKNIIDSVGLGIDIDENTQQKYYVKLPQVIRKSNWSDKTEISDIGYKPLADTFFYNMCESLLFSSEERIKKEFMKLFTSLKLKGKWITQEERNRMSEISKSVTMQRQREFTPYL